MTPEERARFAAVVAARTRGVVVAPPAPPEMRMHAQTAFAPHCPTHAALEHMLPGAQASALEDAATTATRRVLDVAVCCAQPYTEAGLVAALAPYGVHVAGATEDVITLRQPRAFASVVRVEVARDADGTLTVRRYALHTQH